MILDAYPNFSTLVSHLHRVGASIQKAKFDEYEVVSLCAIFMFESE